MKELKQKKARMEKEVKELEVHPTTIAAYVHFQFEKTRKECLEEFRHHYLYAKCSHALCRTFCCCCVPDPTEKLNFKSSRLLVRSEKVPAP